jgi:cob(I)alamin adenosyltransferase
MTNAQRIARQIAHDCLGELENARRALKQLEALLYATSGAGDLGSTQRHLIDLGWSFASDSANAADASCDEICRRLQAIEHYKTAAPKRVAEVRP